MPSVMATLKVKEDKIEEAKTFLTQLSKDTLANEPGTLAYTVHQRKDESDAAFAEHGKNLKAAGAGFAAILAGAPEIVVMDEV